MSTILKWVGGKASLMHHILPKFPKTIHNYHEVCVGGGSVLVAVLNEMKAGNMKIQNVYAWDLNPELINFYHVIQSHKDAFLDIGQKFIDDYNSIPTLKSSKGKREKLPTSFEEALTSKESYFYWHRNEYNHISGSSDNTVRRAVLFYFLNKAGFRGLYRTGPSGYNVPFGSYKTVNLSIDDVNSLHELIQPVHFGVQSFEITLNSLEVGDFAYIDPPYIEVTKTSLTTYMGEFPHDVLLKMLIELQKKEINFVMSNSEVEIIHQTFTLDKFAVNVIEAKRSINSKHPGDKTKETIVSCLFVKHPQT